MVNNQEPKIQRPLAHMAICAEEVNVRCTTVSNGAASGSNEWMGHHFGGTVSMLPLG